MPGLFDLLDGDDARLGLALLAASGPTMQPTNIGQRIAGAVQSVAGQRDNDLRRKLINSQIEENANQNAYRSAQVGKLSQIQNLTSGLLGDWGPTTGATSAAASPAGLPGTVAAPAGLSSTMGGGGLPAAQGAGLGAGPASGLRGIPIERVAALKAAGGPDLIEAWKAVNVPTSLTAGGYAFSPGLPATYLPDPSKGLGIGPGGVFVLPGAGPAQAQLARDTARAQAEEQARYQEATPTYNPDLSKSVRSRLEQYGGAGAMGPGYAGGSAAAAAGGQRDIMQSELASAQQRLAAAQQQGDAQGAARAQQDVLGIQRELQRLPGGTALQAQNVVELPPAMTLQQDARRAGLIKQAESDVTPTADKLARYDNAQQAIGLIDRALQHPGIGTATGMSGTMDPRNYLPGTDAKNFQVLLDQIRGGAFMSAYQSLRGGGAITEKEGEKAQAAIARIDRAQSTEEFERGLRDYRDVLQRGYERARQQLGAVPDATEPRRLPNRTSAAPSDQPPVARLKTAPSDADIRNTALKYGMTVEQVRQRLGMR